MSFGNFTQCFITYIRIKEIFSLTKTVQGNSVFCLHLYDALWG